ncbi:MAG TPA: peptidoglycan DD-metalloendopeptidase family protein, partial [Candidatus Paceibacterota bacterium]|nr:peptidoglycan DD-metalloendopeptidase family protein [Candidatus Paceibacterota bacterium]
QSQIDQSTQQIDQLKQEIAQLQSQLNTTTAQKATLQNAINALNLNIQKIQKSISLTQTQIKQQDLEIGTLQDNIGDTTEKISASESQIADSLRELDSLDNQPLIVTLLSGGSLSSFFDEATTLESLRTSLEQRITTLSGLKTDLQSDESAAQDKRNQLASLNTNLGQQKQSLSIAKDSQTQLLTQTKNQEAAYQAQIAQKQAEEAKFESDLLTYQAQLGLSVTPGSLPAPHPGVLAWPLDNIRITQYFGNTDFATQNPQIYNGKGHTGLDLAASPGTPVKAAMDGVVLGTGNTDLTCPGASFGKWVFIKHPNGLSTLYAHLSSFAVQQGDIVKTGQVIAYSDTTGYATGPHLHFGVYASSGSEIASFASSGCKGKTYTMPVGDVTAYLNPLSYLPAVPGQ